MNTRAGSCLLALWLLTSARADSPGRLPVYIEENHAGSFGWIARNVDLDEPHTLILIDAHSDASAVDHSDEIRHKLRRVSSAQEQIGQITNWRKTGRIEAFNWLEPLMPRPIENVIWVAAPRLTKEAVLRLKTESGECLDGRLGFEARGCGELAERWTVMDFEGLEHEPLPGGPVLATIDLDFFSGIPDATITFQRLWRRLLQCRDLRGVCFAISRPWLKDDAEAFRLLGLALQEVRLTRGASVEWEPFSSGGADHSLRAAELANSGKPFPSWNIADSPPELRAFLLVNRHRWSAGAGAAHWNQLLDRWAEETESWRIDLPLTPDGVWRIPAGELPALRTLSDQVAIAGKVRWWALRPACSCYNLMPGFGPGKDFAREAVPWVREKREFLGETADGALGSDVWQKELSHGWGRVRIEAEVETDHGWIPTPVAELRVGEGSGFHRGLSEQFGIPYAFGIGSASKDGLDGPDVGWGNDCANFLIAAWRQAGLALPWGNPAQLRSRLELFANKVVIADGPVLLPPPGADVIIDFGNHVAALWKDIAPLGKLDAGDEMVHHLSGFPEKLPLGKLASGRPPFDIRTMPRKIAFRLRIGGDVVLTDPPGASASALETTPADLTVVNLEGIPAPPGKRSQSVRYDFSFPPDHMAWLKSNGIGAVSLANNHATDAGPQALASSVNYLKDQGIGAFGTIQNNLIKPWAIEGNGMRLSFFGVSCFPSDQESAVRPVTLPDDEERLAGALSAAKSTGATVIVLVHWGREYSGKPEADQIRWGRWLVDHGADVVAGSHPHVVQPTATYRGRPVAFSLGNAHYPESLRGADSSGWLEIGFDGNGNIISMSDPGKPVSGH